MKDDEAPLRATCRTDAPRERRGTPKGNPGDPQPEETRASPQRLLGAAEPNDPAAPQEATGPSSRNAAPDFIHGVVVETLRARGVDLEPFARLMHYVLTDPSVFITHTVIGLSVAVLMTPDRPRLQMLQTLLFLPQPSGIINQPLIDAIEAKIDHPKIGEPE